jgi:hypothetical protein
MVYQGVYIACVYCDNDMYHFDEVNVIWEGLNFRIEGMDCECCGLNKWFIESFGDDEEE